MAALIADTSALFAAMTDTHPLGVAVRRILEQVDAPPILSPLVLAELDYLVTTRIGVRESLAVIDELTGGAYDIAPVDVDDIRAARPVIATYADLNIGLTDAVNVLLADRHATNKILTLDERHFRTIAPLGSRFQAFALLPMDA